MRNVDQMATPLWNVAGGHGWYLSFALSSRETLRFQAAEMALHWGIVSAGLIASDFTTMLRMLPRSEHQVHPPSLFLPLRAEISSELPGRERN